MKDTGKSNESEKNKEKNEEEKQRDEKRKEVERDIMKVSGKIEKCNNAIRDAKRQIDDNHVKISELDAKNDIEEAERCNKKLETKIDQLEQAIQKLTDKRDQLKDDLNKCRPTS